MDKKIAVLFGQEDTFPWALVNKINEMNIKGISGEIVQIAETKMDESQKYDVIIDRISQDIPYYRSYLKNVMLTGTIVINNPFWWSADDKFLNYSLAHRMGIAIPKTVLLPSKENPPDTNERSMRNLLYPLDWHSIFEYVGFPAFLKPYSGGGWKHVYKINSTEEFFYQYDRTNDMVMTLQEGIEFDLYYRCYVIGKMDVHIMQYDPAKPYHEQYSKSPDPIPSQLEKRIKKDCITICETLGYDINTCEFAVRGGIPYAIDFGNPAPDADYHSVGEDNFNWIVNSVAKFAIELAKVKRRPVGKNNWKELLTDGIYK